MANIRRVVAYPAAISAGATLAVTNVQTPDDNYPRRLKSVFVNPATFDVEVIIYRAGFQLEDFDATRCAAGNWPMHIDEVYPALIQFSYSIVNHTGSSYTGSVTFEYEPGAQSGANPVVPPTVP